MVSLRCDTPDGRETTVGLRRDARQLLKLLNLNHAELSILLTGDAAIRELNRAFRSKDKATDVLSFPQIEEGSLEAAASGALSRSDAPPLMLGDIVISIDTAARQAQAIGQTLPIRLRTLLIHGLLHLLGYDHERSAIEARRMFALERKLAADLDGARNANDRAPRRPVQPLKKRKQTRVSSESG